MSRPGFCVHLGDEITLAQVESLNTEDLRQDLKGGSSPWASQSGEALDNSWTWGSQEGCSSAEVVKPPPSAPLIVIHPAESLSLEPPSPITRTIPVQILPPVVAPEERQQQVLLSTAEVPSGSGSLSLSTLSSARPADLPSDSPEPQRPVGAQRRASAPSANSVSPGPGARRRSSVASGAPAAAQQPFSFVGPREQELADLVRRCKTDPMATSEVPRVPFGQGDSSPSACSGRFGQSTPSSEGHKPGGGSRTPSKSRVENWANTPKVFADELVGGVWVCPSCHSENGRKRKECMSCGKPRDPGDTSWMASIKAPDPDAYWDCVACKARNAGRHDRCQFCGCARGSLLWECRRCHTENGHRRDKCIECGAPRVWTTTVQPPPKEVREKLPEAALRPKSLPVGADGKPQPLEAVYRTQSGVDVLVKITRLESDGECSITLPDGTMRETVVDKLDIREDRLRLERCNLKIRQVLKERKWDQAESCCAEALQLDKALDRSLSEEEQRRFTAALYANRSMARLELGQLAPALRDADAAIEARPDWARGFSRKAVALEAAGQSWHRVVEAIRRGMACGDKADELDRRLLFLTVCLQGDATLSAARRELLERGANICWRWGEKLEEVGGFTALHAAALTHCSTAPCPRLLQLLCEQSRSVNEVTLREQMQLTPFHVLVLMLARDEVTPHPVSSTWEAAEILLAHGAAVNAPYRFGTLGELTIVELVAWAAFESRSSRMAAFDSLLRSWLASKPPQPPVPEKGRSASVQRKGSKASSESGSQAGPPANAGKLAKLPPAKTRPYAMQLKDLSSRRTQCPDTVTREALSCIEQLLRETCVENSCLPSTARGFGGYVKVLFEDHRLLPRPLFCQLEEMRVLRNVVTAHGNGITFLAAKAHEVLFVLSELLAWTSGTEVEGIPA